MKTNAQKLKGTIFLTQKGRGFFSNDDLKEDIEIAKENLATALHGDEVEISINSKKGEAKVEQVLSRAKFGFSGIFKKEGQSSIVRADDKKMYADILIPAPSTKGAKEGDKVYAEITLWDDASKLPKGEVIKVLGKAGENNAEMHAIAMERGFDSDFNQAVEKEAQRLAQRGVTDEDLKDRRDMRKTLTFTIDPDDAKDFDDAISFKVLGGGKDETLYEVGIHIADVSHYVKIGSDLDKEARTRGTSVYLVDRTIPMLPEALSNNLCSLVPNEDRLTMSAIFTLDKDGEVKDQRYGKTVIHSQKRFTYEEAEQAIKDPKLPLHKELSTLNKVAKNLKEERFLDGAISLEQDEVKFVLDKNGVPIKIIKKTRGDSNKMIEELMLLANRKVAEMMTKQTKKGVFLYRIHDMPTKEKMDDLIYFLRSLGYEFPTEKGIITNQTLNKLLKNLEEKTGTDAVHKAVIRSMTKAIYSTKNLGHYGLAFEYYTHFTSPIRRYPDIVVHRLLNDFVNNKKIGRDKLHIYEEISRKSSEREKYATDAERASIKYKQAEYMNNHKDEVFQGVISGVTEWGFYVEEVETKSEGLVRARDIAGDYYVWNEKRMELIGKKTGKKYRFGDKVKIKVREVDLERKNIDYQLV